MSAIGVRECFVPRPGHLLCSVDYSQLELCTLAQTVYDAGCGSVLRDAINAGRDLHLDFACDMRGWSYDDVFALKKQQPYKDARQAAKAANFGFPGGLGIRRFVGYAWDSYQVKLSESQAAQYQAMWRRKWPDCRAFQNLVAAATSGPSERTGVIIDRTGFARGDCKYSEACNTPFQGLAAGGAKRALWRLCKEGNALGIYPVAFVHDEVIAEVLETRAHEAAFALANLMCEEMQALCPDVRISAEPALARRWYKAMEPVFRDGRLVPWEPKA